MMQFYYRKQITHITDYFNLCSNNIPVGFTAYINTQWTVVDDADTTLIKCYFSFIAVYFVCKTVCYILAKMKWDAVGVQH